MTPARLGRVAAHAALLAALLCAGGLGLLRALPCEHTSAVRP